MSGVGWVLRFTHQRRRFDFHAPNKRHSDSFERGSQREERAPDYLGEATLRAGLETPNTGLIAFPRFFPSRTGPFASRVGSMENLRSERTWASSCPRRFLLTAPSLPRVLSQLQRALRGSSWSPTGLKACFVPPGSERAASFSWGRRTRWLRTEPSADQFLWVGHVGFLRFLWMKVFLLAVSVRFCARAACCGAGV